MLFKQCLCPCHSSTRIVYSISITLCESSKSWIILFDRLIPTQVRLFSLELKYLFFSILIFDLLPLFQVFWILDFVPLSCNPSCDLRLCNSLTSFDTSFTLCILLKKCFLSLHLNGQFCLVIFYHLSLFWNLSLAFFCLNYGSNCDFFSSGTLLLD